MPDPIDRITLGPVQNPVRGLLHGSAACAAAALAVHFGWWVDCDPALRRGLVLLATSQAALFAASASYHSVPWSPAWKARMQRVDHSMIFVKIAGSITPIVWLAFEDGRRGALIAAAWTVAAIGIAQKLWWPKVHPKACIPLQIGQALLVVPAIGPVCHRFPGMPAVLLAVSAAVYLAGVLVFVTERPRLWPRVFSHHELFHVFTVIGSGTHYALAMQFLTRLS